MAVRCTHNLFLTPRLATRGGLSTIVIKLCNVCVEPHVTKQPEIVAATLSDNNWTLTAKVLKLLGGAAKKLQKILNQCDDDDDRINRCCDELNKFYNKVEDADLDAFHANVSPHFIRGGHGKEKNRDDAGTSAQHAAQRRTFHEQLSDVQDRVSKLEDIVKLVSKIPWTIGSTAPIEVSSDEEDTKLPPTKRTGKTHGSKGKGKDDDTDEEEEEEEEDEMDGKDVAMAMAMRSGATEQSATDSASFAKKHRRRQRRRRGLSDGQGQGQGQDQDQCHSGQAQGDQGSC